jgi:plastocyanin
MYQHFGELTSGHDTGNSRGAAVTTNLTHSNQFQPATLTVARGTTVTWANTGFAPHTVTDDATA